MRTILVVMLALVLAACSSAPRSFEGSGLYRTAPEQKVVVEDDIKHAFALKPQLPAPFRLAVYFKPNYDRSWQWRGEDKDRLLQMGAELKGKKIISDMIVLQDDLVEGGDRRAVRLAAARAGADAVLMVNGDGNVETSSNPLSLTYVLIVPYLLAPGTQADGLFVARATMWDVRNQYLYLAAEAEGTARQTRPGYFIEEAELVKAAKGDAIAALTKRLGGQLGDMAAK